jgi:SAM-dependent methyltransferase
MGSAEHWNDRYRTVGVSAVSWHEPRPALSLELPDLLGVTPEHSVIDIGGGASTLVDHLLDRGHRDVAVLDVSSVAIAAARGRLADPDAVTWIEHDLLTWEPPRQWAVWHDRAVLHFLIDEEDRAAYTGLLRRTIESGGAFVIGAFAEDGPTQCSALPVRRYPAEELVTLLGDIDVVEQRRYVHRTPGGANQPFNWIVGCLRRGR